MNYQCVFYAYITCVCSTDLCNDWDVKLTGGTVMNEGRLELCLHQRWGTVSDGTWSNEEAQVVCRQLGYSTEGSSVLLCTVTIAVYMCSFI